ncbi:hypothetical protein [Duganella radicis]|uniref:Uncharacterized protein n=1 Tax=Duganella radicis TaxID=551988 RepID=A0A6L6PJL2_9BURK|nr:hypothetical protein [Duganella radicis]MTV39142.1 hypothetical protein [Duganella radicis]
MQHTPFPYQRAPDAFFMALPQESAFLQIKGFETPWGMSDEQLCYWNGVLFGQSVQGSAGRFVKLLPVLDRQRDYPWPSAETFKATILGILDQFPDLEVWCERDCDQYPIMSLNSLAELERNLELVFSFCENGRGECPSFSYRP